VKKKRPEQKEALKMVGKKKLLTTRLLLFLTVGLCMMLQACDSGDAARGEKMNSDPKTGLTKPPIDLAAPARVETATFALG
jgi:hypothetical protein